MRPLRSWIVLATLAAFAGQAAVVYKWTDADGVVHYSDQPVPGAERIVTAGKSSAGPASSSGAASGTPAAKKPTVPGLNYSQFAITSPVPDQTFFGDEVIGARLALTPDLKPNQTITWHLSGKELDEGANLTQFSLPHLDRGVYVIAATLTDQTTGASQTTDSVSFFVRQPSLLSPAHQKP